MYGWSQLSNSIDLFIHVHPWCSDTKERHLSSFRMSPSDTVLLLHEFWDQSGQQRRIKLPSAASEPQKWHLSWCTPQWIVSGKSCEAFGGTTGPPFQDRSMLFCPILLGAHHSAFHNDKLSQLVMIISLVGITARDCNRTRGAMCDLEPMRVYWVYSLTL